MGIDGHYILQLRGNLQRYSPRVMALWHAPYPGQPAPGLPSLVSLSCKQTETLRFGSPLVPQVASRQARLSSPLIESVVHNQTITSLVERVVEVDRPHRRAEGRRVRPPGRKRSLPPAARPSGSSRRARGPDSPTRLLVGAGSERTGVVAVTLAGVSGHRVVRGLAAACGDDEGGHNLHRRPSHVLLPSWQLGGGGGGLIVLLLKGHGGHGVAEEVVRSEGHPRVRRGA